MLSNTFDSQLCKNNSFFLGVPHAFFSFMLPAVRNALLTLLAFRGHTAMQRIQEIHAEVSVFDGSSSVIAPTGHSFAHRPHWIQAFPALGFMGTPPYSR